jgi:hypothetical protein
MSEMSTFFGFDNPCSKEKKKKEKRGKTRRKRKEFRVF